MTNDRSFLKRAVKIAGSGIKEGGGPFGAVITRDGKILAEANNRVVLSHDPTAHAEVLAIRKACEFLKTHDLSGCILYASCEPCPMCLGAIYWSGIRKVVYASDRSDAEASGFNDSLIYSEIKLDPADRRVSFIHMPDAGGEEAFRIWEQFESKIPY
ncbi:MAG: tRNA-specific adenosine deaminase [Bacteroidetes bacterium RBG_13_43_22]|nr:MAG: tRNA-specific adenosine deaminase [Bacteroidetes bacterium RBG_13_43_22]